MHLAFQFRKDQACLYSNVLNPDEPRIDAFQANRRHAVCYRILSFRDVPLATDIPFYVSSQPLLQNHVLRLHKELSV